MQTFSQHWPYNFMLRTMELKFMVYLYVILFYLQSTYILPKEEQNIYALFHTIVELFLEMYILYNIYLHKIQHPKSLVGRVYLIYKIWFILSN